MLGADSDDVRRLISPKWLEKMSSTDWLTSSTSIGIEIAE
jgi:hypothetical protein